MNHSKDFKIALITALFLLFAWAVRRLWRAIRWILRELWELGDDEEDEARRRRSKQRKRKQPPQAPGRIASEL